MTLPHSMGLELELPAVASLDDAYVFGQNANTGRSTKIGTVQVPNACGGLPSHLTKPLTYIFLAPAQPKFLARAGGGCHKSSF